MPATDAMGRTIREFLKQGTAAEHDTLDARLGSLVLADRDGYAQFLDIQYRARRGVERWLEARALDNPPPPQSDLVARDLASLDRVVPTETPDSRLRMAATRWGYAGYWPDRRWATGPSWRGWRRRRPTSPPPSSPTRAWASTGAACFLPSPVLATAASMTACCAPHVPHLRIST